MNAADETRMCLARADKLADLASWGNGNPKASRLAVRCILRATDALGRLEEEHEQMRAAAQVLLSACEQALGLLQLPNGHHGAMIRKMLARDALRMAIAKAKESEVPR